MKRKILLGILLAAILLFPIPKQVKDGGTVEYTAILYKVSKVHSLTSVEEACGTGKMYNEVIIIEILGFEVFNNVK